tara:strand:- start:10877 stop:13027 length:2151 start_codon:yes stop_codon:yes gene_type:complete
MSFSIKDHSHMLLEMKLSGAHLCNLFYLVLIGVSVLFTFMNRRIDSDLWPVPDNVVLHNVIPFDVDNQLYKIFADSESDLLKLIYSEKPDTMNANAWNLKSLEVMQYISGCYPELVLKTTDHSILSGPGNTAKVHEAVGGATTDTSINIDVMMTNLQANDHLAIYTKKAVGTEFVYNLEVVKVTVVSGADLTVTRNQDLATHGIVSNGIAPIPKDTYVYRIAAGNYGENFQQPYVVKSLASGTMKSAYDTAKSSANTAGRNPSSLCTCLHDASKIVNNYDSAPTATLTLFEALETESTADTKFGHTLDTDGPHKRVGMRNKETTKNAINVFKKDLSESGQSSLFKIRAVDSCLATHIPQYTVKYKGVIDTRHIGDNGQYLLYLGILTVVLNRLYSYSVSKETSYKITVQMLVVCIAIASIVSAILNYTQDYHATGCDETDATNDKRCNTKRDLLNNRDGTYESPYLVLTTLYQATTTFSYIVIGLFATVRAFIMIADAKFTGAYVEYFNFEGAIPRRIGVDLPFITGYACMGTALLAQSGVQDLTSLMFSFTVLFITGFMQHISNVCKIMYDTLCKHTSPAAMDSLFKKQPEEGSYASETLQFFGWSRLFMFVTIGLATLSFMTMTREVVESNHVQTFTNGQLFYFALAFFWSNIGYDVVRELIPFTFEKIHMDHSKILITGLYLVYYNLTMYYFVDQIKNNGEINEFTLHGARTM